MSQSSKSPEQLRIDQLEKINVALGKIAPKGTWFCEQLEEIWRAKTTEEAIKVAEYMRLTIHNMNGGTVEHALWAGDRVPK